MPISQLRAHWNRADHDQGQARRQPSGRGRRARRATAVVRVSARAAGGQATAKEALAAIASAFGVRGQAVTLVTGKASRDEKYTEVAGADPAVLDRLLVS